MHESTFHIPKMDCAAEEQLVRMKLQDDPGIKRLSFDLKARKLTVVHQTAPDSLAATLAQLNLGSELVDSRSSVAAGGPAEDRGQKKLLWTVLLINFGCFVLELATGLLSRSMGLVADSLDMLADSLVYGLALLAVGGTTVRKKRVATAAGYFQMLLAVLGFAEVVRRFFGLETPPVFSTMIIVSLIALAGNAISLWLLHRSRSEDPHMRASMIFTSNDVIINLGVIAAGVLVYFTGSNKPDLIIGSIVFVIVMRGAVRILRL